jgi:hypothetical protein
MIHDENDCGIGGLAGSRSGLGGGGRYIEPDPFKPLYSFLGSQLIALRFLCDKGKFWLRDNEKTNIFDIERNSCRKTCEPADISLDSGN